MHRIERKSTRLTLVLSLSAVVAGGTMFAADPSPGTLDSTFNPILGPYPGTYSLAVQPSGTILIGGEFTRVNGAVQNYFSALSPTGTVATAYTGRPGADGSLHVIAQQNDGKIWLGGEFYTVNGASWRGVARMKADGTMDESFNSYPGMNGRVYALAVQPDGKVIIGGNFTTIGTTSRQYLARLEVNGALDTTFSAPTDGYVFSLAVRPDGKILVGGEFNHIRNINRTGLALLNSDGTVDSGFTPNPDGPVYAITIQTNGQVLLGGMFYSVAGANQQFLSRLNADGGRDQTFTTSVSGTVRAIVVQPNGKILIGGRFSTVNGTTRNNIARLLPTGAIDSEFDTGVGPNNTVFAIALQTDGKILLGGEFLSVSSEGRTTVARLYGDTPPPPVEEGRLEIRHAVEIAWPSLLNARYQVRWSSEIAPSLWQNFGDPVLGNGTTNRVFDGVQQGLRKFYKVEKLP